MLLLTLSPFGRRATALQAVANAVVARLKSHDADDNEAVDAARGDW